MSETGAVDAIRSEIVERARALVADGLVVGTAGNLSAREGDRIAVTPSGVDYATMTPADVVVVDLDGTVVEGGQTRLGEAWRRGEVVLSWGDVVTGAANPRDGRNLVLHEFAHKLDMEDGAVDGAPALTGRSHYAAWARVLSQEFLALQASAARGKKSVLDAYGATSPPEFFAGTFDGFVDGR